MQICGVEGRGLLPGPDWRGEAWALPALIGGGVCGVAG